jgi:hypothetical protein
MQNKPTTIKPDAMTLEEFAQQYELHWCAGEEPDDGPRVEGADGAVWLADADDPDDPQWVLLYDGGDNSQALIDVVNECVRAGMILMEFERDIDSSQLTLTFDGTDPAMRALAAQTINPVCADCQQAHTEGRHRMPHRRTQ